MDTQQNEQPGWQSEGESLNTGSAGNAEQVNESGQEQDTGEKKKGGIHNNALYAAGMGRSATAQVDPHSNSGLANTGTNTSYEGPTAPGAGGSAGTGYASGQEAVNPTISTSSDYDMAGVGRTDKDAAADTEEEPTDETRDNQL